MARSTISLQAASPLPSGRPAHLSLAAVVPFALVLALGGCATKALTGGSLASQKGGSSAAAGRTGGPGEGSDTASSLTTGPGGAGSSAPASGAAEGAASAGGTAAEGTASQGKAGEAAEGTSASNAGGPGGAAGAEATGGSQGAGAAGAQASGAEGAGGPGGAGGGAGQVAAGQASSPEGAGGDNANGIPGMNSASSEAEGANGAANGAGGAAAGGVAGATEGGKGISGATQGMEANEGARGGDVDSRVAAIDVPNSNVKVDEDYRPQTLGGMLPLILGVNEEGRFDFDQYALRDETKAILDQLAEKLKTADYDRLDIVGYTDRIGAPEYNQRLSELRAWSVAQYLMSRGVPDNKVHYEGRGRSDPVTKPQECTGLARDDLIACLQKDRRVEIDASIRRKHATVTQ